MKRKAAPPPEDSVALVRRLRVVHDWGESWRWTAWLATPEDPGHWVIEVHGKDREQALARARAVEAALAAPLAST